MRVKLIVGFLLVVSTVSIFGQNHVNVPSEYIGTWVIVGEEYGETMAARMIMRTDSLSLFMFGQQISAEIVSHRGITNEEPSTRLDYANGLLISIRQAQTGNVVAFQVF